MFAKGKGSSVPSDGQARENVFWDLYCAAPERRDTCEHSSEAKAFHDYGPPGSQPSPHAQPPPHNPNMMGPHSQPPGGIPGAQPLLPNTMDPTRQQGHPNMGGPMQRMNPPRGMGPMGPGPQIPYSSSSPGTYVIPYSSSSPGTYVGPPGGGGPPGTPIMPSPAADALEMETNDTKQKKEHRNGHIIHQYYSVMFPMGPGSDGPMGGMSGMEPHHMNGSLGKPSLRVRNSPNNISGISNPPGTPRDDGELGGNFLHSFQNDNYSPSMTMSV
ncbi:Single-stranded DNA-binding protein 3 [Acipenser ruthenus]|uniref:Single-stranded DNA-binding protein 3 n=1 Tax=Acipenser ruthenus TaxID=7906 RepID=A0A444U1U6_ACIRT|nr:Single-stranded DNA-binding protein 3 [Acipenser ruthenus]